VNDRANRGMWLGLRSVLILLCTTRPPLTDSTFDGRFLEVAGLEKSLHSSTGYECFTLSVLTHAIMRKFLFRFKIVSSECILRTVSPCVGQRHRWYVHSWQHRSLHCCQLRWYQWQWLFCCDLCSQQVGRQRQCGGGRR
jgi:hypothetical protein